MPSYISCRHFDAPIYMFPPWWCNCCWVLERPSSTIHRGVLSYLSLDPSKLQCPFSYYLSAIRTPSYSICNGNWNVFFLLFFFREPTVEWYWVYLWYFHAHTPIVWRVLCWSCPHFTVGCTFTYTLISVSIYHYGAVENGGKKTQIWRLLRIWQNNYTAISLNRKQRRY